MEEDFTAVLLAAAGVIAEAGDRITWGRRTQGEGLPAVVLHRITPGRHYTMRGPSRTADPIIQVDCWAATYAAVKRLERAVIAALEGLAHERIQGAFLIRAEDGVETDDASQAGSSTDFYRSSLDFRVWHTAAS